MQLPACNIVPYFRTKYVFLNWTTEQSEDVNGDLLVVRVSAGLLRNIAANHTLEAPLEQEELPLRVQTRYGRIPPER